MSALNVSTFSASPETLTKVSAAAAEDAERNDRDATFPHTAFDRLHGLGLFDFLLREGDNRPSLVELTRVVQAAAQGDPSVALVLVNTLHAIERQKDTHSYPEHVYQEILVQAAGGPVHINSARAEPELGAPARGGLPATTARRTADGWLISGRKAYVTGSHVLDYHQVWAKTDEDPLRVGHFVVPGFQTDGSRTPGIEVLETWDHLGLRGSQTHDVIYSDVLVPLDHFIEIPFVNGRYVDPVGRGGPGSLLHVAIYVGVARAAQEFFIRFTKERVPAALGQPIATTERIQTVAGEIESQLVQAEELLYAITARTEAGDRDAIARSVSAKVLIARSAVTAVETAVAALGNPALSRRNPLERHLRDVLCSRVHPPQEDAALRLVGRRTLGQE